VAVAGSASTIAEQVSSFSASRDGAVLSYWTGIVQTRHNLYGLNEVANRSARWDTGSQGNAHISPDGTKSPLKSTIHRSATPTQTSGCMTLCAESKHVYGKARDGQGTLLVARRETHCFSAQTGEVILTSMKNPPMVWK